MAAEEENIKFERSAAVLKIVSRNVKRRDIADFIWEFEEYTHPSIVLEDNVSLYTLTATEAIFVDCGHVDVFDPKYTFAYIAQHEEAVRLIALPLASLNQIAKEITFPSVPILHLVNHSRCGSTLMSKVFAAIPNALSISETYALTELSLFSRLQRFNASELKELCLDVIKCTLKHANARASELVFYKGQSHVLYITDLIMDVAPTVKHVYMYREPIPFIQSWQKLVIANNWKSLPIQKFDFILAGIGAKILSCFPLYTEEVLDNMCGTVKFAWCWVSSTGTFNALLEKNYDLKSLKYEDLLSDRYGVLSSLFSYIGVPLSYLPDIDKIFPNDSQAGSMFSTRTKEIGEKLLISEDVKLQIDKFCADFKIESFWGEIKLKNNILDD